MQIGEYLSQAISLTVDYARAGERVRAAMVAVQAVVEPLKEILEVDGTVGPEILAAATALDEAHTALARATTFLTARYEAQMDKLNANKITGGDGS